MGSTTPQIQDPRYKQTISIASGVAISSAIDTAGYRVAAFDMSSGWDAANRMTFRVSQDGTSFFDMYNDAGTEYNIASGTPFVSSTGRSIIPNADLALALLAHRYFKIQAGPSTAPANLTTGITIDVILAPL